MEINKYSESHLFKCNSKEQIKRWIYELNFFVFTRSCGGHGDGPDELITAIKFENEEEFSKLIKTFNLPAEFFNSEKEKSFDPRVDIFNYKCFVVKGLSVLIIKPCHNWSYIKDDDDFLACKLIEKVILENNLENKVAIEYLLKTPSIITKELYGDYFV